MPRPRKSVPSYEHHKPRNLAYVRIPNGKGGRRIIYLGRYDSPESHTEYRRVLAELQTKNDSPPLPIARPSAVCVNEILVGFMRFAQTHYRNRPVQLFCALNSQGFSRDGRGRRSKRRLQFDTINREGMAAN